MTKVDRKRDEMGGAQGNDLIPEHMLIIPVMLTASSARGGIDAPLWMYDRLGKASHAAMPYPFFSY